MNLSPHHLPEATSPHQTTPRYTFRQPVNQCEPVAPHAFPLFRMCQGYSSFDPVQATHRTSGASKPKRRGREGDANPLEAYLRGEGVGSEGLYDLITYGDVQELAPSVVPAKMRQGRAEMSDPGPGDPHPLHRSPFPSLPLSPSPPTLGSSLGPSAPPPLPSSSHKLSHSECSSLPATVERHVGSGRVGIPPSAPAAKLLPPERSPPRPPPTTGETLPSASQQSSPEEPLRPPKRETQQMQVGKVEEEAFLNRRGSPVCPSLFVGAEELASPHPTRRGGVPRPLSRGGRGGTPLCQTLGAAPLSPGGKGGAPLSPGDKGCPREAKPQRVLTSKELQEFVVYLPAEGLWTVRLSNGKKVGYQAALYGNIQVRCG